MTETKTRFVKIKSLSQGSSYIERFRDLHNIVDMMEAAPEGDGYEIVVVEMTEEEFEAMPEFDGF